jgi:hypothetical protein
VKAVAVAVVLLAANQLCACGGAGGYGTTYPAPAAIVTAAPQVITMSLPGSAIGVENDPAFGLVSGYTQQVYSQTLAFVPGAQVMISNGEAGVPHTLNVLSQSAFPVNPVLSTAPSGGTTLANGYASGAVAPDSMIGPITLTAGIYYIGCAFHYTSNAMRTVLTVAAAAVPGPQATPVPGAAFPAGGFGY